MGKYLAYSAYKDSGVEWLGDVPEHFEVIKLRFLLRENLSNGIFKKAVSWGMGCLIVNVFDVYIDNDVIDESSLDRVECSEDEQQHYSAKHGDFFFVRSSLKTSGVGKSAMVLNPIDDIVFECHLVRGQPDLGKIEPRFLNLYLNALFARHYLVARANFVTMATIDQMKFKDLPICMPSFLEQQQIAHFLDTKTAHLDKLIGQKQQMIGLLNEKRMALITQVVTKGLDLTVPMKGSGVEWLGEVPKHWGVMRLKFLIATRKGIPFKPEDFSNDGVSVVKASDIKEKTIKQSIFKLPEEFCDIYPKAILKDGELVVSTVGSVPEVKNSAVGQIGRVPKYLDGALLNQNTVVFSADGSKLSKEYLFFLLCGTAYREHLDLYAHGTANQASLNIQDMLNFLSSMPPVNEQQQITDYLDTETQKIDDMIKTVKQAIATLQEYRTALITAAVTGKIDVRNSDNWDS